MLAQNFKTAKELDIPQDHYDALRKTLVLMETDKLIHTLIPLSEFDLENGHEFSGHFNMVVWTAGHKCGTIACIGGTAELVGGLEHGSLCNHDNVELIKLFFPNHYFKVSLLDITVEQAARALRSFLTFGESNWYKILKGQA